MNEDMSEIINKINSMMNSDNSTSGNSSISPEAISKMLDILKTKTSNDNKNESNTHSNSDNYNSNIDVETLLKFKTIFEKMNSKDDPRNNLLLALKPYLKDSRKQKIEQYIQFLSISKLLDEFGHASGGDITK